MIPGIDPKVDYAFKRLFGREQNRALLIHLIDSVLDPPQGEEIREIQILNPFNEKEAPDDKWSILDIKARDAQGRQFNVEMQMLAGHPYKHRSLYYWSRLHQEQLREGEDYNLLRPTISISFVNTVLFPAVPEYHLCFRLLDDRHHLRYTDDLVMHLVELPKFSRAPEQLSGRLDAWAYFLRHAETLDTDALPDRLNIPPIKDALEELRMLTHDEREHYKYEDRRKGQLDALSFIKEISRQQDELYRRQADLDRRQEEWSRRQEELRRAQDELFLRQDVVLARDQTIGSIHLFQRRLGRPLTPSAELVKLPPEELAGLAESLEREVFG